MDSEEKKLIAEMTVQELTRLCLESAVMVNRKLEGRALAVIVLVTKDVPCMAAVAGDVADRDQAMHLLMHAAKQLGA